MNQRDLFLLDSARLFLAPGVVVETSGLKDCYSGDTCALNALGRDILPRLKTGATIEELVPSIVATYQIAESIARADLHRFITSLYAAGLLSIRQSYLGEAAARLQLRVSRLLRRPVPARGKRSPYRRYPATAWGILSGSIRAHQPTAAAGLLLAVAIQPIVFQVYLRHGYWPSPWLVLRAALPAVVFTVLLIGSIVLHELIHYWTARRLGVQLRSVYVGPGRVGITQLEVGSLKNAAVSVAGPAGTVLVLLAVAMLLPALHLGYPLGGIAAPMLCLAVGIVHLLGLTPVTNDGKQLWKLMGFVPSAEVA